MKDTGLALFTSQRAQEDKIPVDLEGCAILQMENCSGASPGRQFSPPTPPRGLEDEQAVPPPPAQLPGAVLPCQLPLPSQSANGWTVLGPRGNLCAKR